MKRITAALLACLLTVGMLVPGTAAFAEENEEMILLDESEEMIIAAEEDGRILPEEVFEITPADASDEMSFKGAKKIDNGNEGVNYLITINPGDLLTIDGNVLFNGKAMSSSDYYWVGGLVLAHKNKDGTYSEELGQDSSSIAVFDGFNPLVAKAVGPGIVCMFFNSKEGFNGKEQNAYGLTLWIEVEESKPIECTKITLNKTKAEIATGSTLQLEATLKPNNTTDKTVTWKSSNSKVASVDKNGKVTANKYGTATITATTSNGKKATCQIQTRFKDVNDSSKSYYKAVYWAVDSGITKCSVTFKPNDGVTRGEFVAFLYRMANSPEVTKYATKFKDVTSTTKFYKEISWAVNKGIIKGFSDKTFRPNDGVTRSQAVIMLWRYMEKPAPSAAVSPFSDVKYAKTDTVQAILWGNENGIIKGYSDGTFRAAEKCTRANVVTFLYRIHQKSS